jgi:hypothetical protein
MQTISAYILTYNEAEKLKAAAESVLWADEDLLEPNRIVEILAVVVNTADAIDHYQLAFHEIPKPVVQALVFGEPAMSAQVELVSVVFECCGQPANVVVALEHSDANSVRAQLVSCGQSSRACAENDDVFGTGYLTSPFRRYLVTTL